MEIEEPISRIDDFTNYYEQCIVKMVGENSAQSKALEQIKKVFEELEISSEQKGQALTELSVQMAVQFNKDATGAALELIRMEPEFELKSAQRDFTIRQIQGYDDNLLLKIVEEQGGLASFAVNAGSDSAQTTINDLKAKMTAVESRVKTLDGSSSCQTTTPITPIPTNLVPAEITSSSITISWNPVVNATSYLVYKDGLLAATSGSLSFVDTELNAETKYAYTVKASINGVLSDHTNTLVVTTTIE